MNRAQFKLNKLKKILKAMGSVLVAYSGGVDSVFLLKIAVDVLGNNVLAVTADSPLYSRDELKFSKQKAGQLKVKHKIISLPLLNDKRFLENGPNRCYFCKKELFNRLRAIARKNRLNLVIDGSNVSDRRDFRPGERAMKESNIRSPLREAGLEKEEIRILSKQMGLETYNKPSLACLASRVAYGVRITEDILKRIESAEKFIRSMGFRQVRVRDDGKSVRIEVDKGNICELIADYRLLITDYLKKLGYNYITVDLEGYRPGSMNY